MKPEFIVNRKNEDYVVSQERVRVIKISVLYVRLLYVSLMIFLGYYCAKNDGYSVYMTTILSMVLTANLIWIIGDIIYSSVRTTLYIKDE